MTDNKKLGPNMRELLARFIAIEAVPIGGSLADGLHFLTAADRRQQGISRAISNTKMAIEVVKSAPDNPFGDDDEAIAAAILERIKAQEDK